MTPLAESPGREPQSRAAGEVHTLAEAPMVSPGEVAAGWVQPALPGPGSSEAACGVDGHALTETSGDHGDAQADWCCNGQDRSRAQRPGHAASTDFCQDPTRGWRIE